MAKVTYEKEVTALVVIDPYNDFISKGGLESLPFVPDIILLIWYGIYWEYK